MKDKPYPCADCKHYTRSHANNGGTKCWCDCPKFREPDLTTRLMYVLDDFTENALNLESAALDAQSRRHESYGVWRPQANEAWRAANLLRDALYACESCGHSTEPLGLGSNGSHSEDDPTQCWECGINAEPCLSRGEPA